MISGNGRSRKRAPGGTTGIQLLQISLFIILLAFFIMLNAIAVEDKARKLSALGSLKESFGFSEGGISVIDTNGGELIRSPLPAETGRINFTDLFNHPDGRSDQLTIAEDNRGTVVRIPADLLFQPRKTTLEPAGHATLDALIDIVRKIDDAVDIVGHTDDVVAADTATLSKTELTAARAMNLMRYFVEKGRIDPKRLTAYGWGADWPLASNKTRETRAQNRRMEIVFVHRAPLKKPISLYTFKDFFFRALD